MGVSKFYDQMQEISVCVPVVKFLPEKVDNLQMGLHGLRDRMVQDYVTFEQIEETLRRHQNEVYQKCKEDFDGQMDDFRRSVLSKLPSKDVMQLLGGEMGSLASC